MHSQSSLHARWLTAVVVAFLFGLAAATFFSGSRGPGTVPGEPEPAPASLPESTVKDPVGDPPVPLRTLIPPWSRHHALVLSMPLQDAMQDEAFGFSLVELARITAPWMDVYILIPDWGKDQLTFIRSLIENHVDLVDHQERLHFVRSRIGSRWIRDYGPFFGVSSAGDLVFLDARNSVDADPYQDALELWSQAGRGGATLSEMEQLENQVILAGDELAPADLARYFRNNTPFPVELVRVPIHLQGGDFLYDGQGTLFVSEATLQANGGNRARFEARLRSYFGVTRIGYLEVLPGDSVPHLDVIAKFLDPETLLMAELTHEPPPERLYLQQLYRDARRILDNNVAVVRRMLPDIEIVRVPQPPPLTDSMDVIQQATKDMLLEQAALDIGLNWNLVGGLPPDDDRRRSAERQIRAFLQAELGPLDLDSLEGWDKLARHYMLVSFADLAYQYAEEKVRFRTYINSLHLRPGLGREFLVFPVYTPALEWEGPLLERYEAEARAVYQRFLPAAEIFDLNCDAAIALDGAVHCFTLTVPDLDAVLSGN